MRFTLLKGLIIKALWRSAFTTNANAAAPIETCPSSMTNGSNSEFARSNDHRHVMPPRSPRLWPYLLATTLVSGTVVLLEIALTRFLSLFLHHYVVFVVLSVALLGLGIGAVFCAIQGHRWWRFVFQSPAGALWQVCLASGATLVMSTVLLTQTALAGSPLATAALTLVPFVGAGLFLALLFTVQADQSRLLYAADLGGAGLGCLVSLWVLHRLGAENALALAALGFLTAAALLALTADRQHWPFPVLVCLLLGGLLGFTMVSGKLAITTVALRRSTKHLGSFLRAYPEARLVASRWSALARTDVLAFASPQPQPLAAFTDSGAATSLVPLPTTSSEWRQIDRLAEMFPYRTAPRRHVLILGSGGGFDVLLALRGGARSITAVEVNPDILHAVERFIPPERNVYRRPAVKTVHGDGRQVVRQSARTYDLIVLPQVYTGAAQWQSGTLAENYLLTVEAFQDYLAHLTPQGRLVVQVHSPAEALKVALMGLRALSRRGISAAAGLDHVLIFQEGSAAPPASSMMPPPPLILLKNTPYTPAESRQQATVLQTMQHTALFIPYLAVNGPFEKILRRAVTPSTLSLPRLPSFRSATDNRPFFYETGTEVTSLSWLIFVVLLLLCGLFLGYAVSHRRGDDTTPMAASWLLLFAATGCAALLSQGALLQRAMLILGSPALTLIALLFPLLCFGGVGSLVSAGLRDRTLHWFLPWSCLALGLLVALSVPLFATLQPLLAAQSLAVRVLGIIVFLAPLGVLMGVPFPVALRLLSLRPGNLMPWVWGVNTVGCVLGIAGAIRLAIAWGLQEAALGGALLYVLAGWWSRRLLVKT